MDIGLLRIFMAVAEVESVSKAAERLFCVQSNVTTRIRHLEDELGAKLFYRKKRGMALTPSGKILLKYADQIIRLTAEAEKAVRSTGQIRGPLAIGTMESTAAVHLPAILTRYCQEYPEVDLSLTTGTSEELIGKVLNYQLDGAFVGGPVQHADIAQEPIFNEELVLVTKDQIESVETVTNPTVLVFRRGCTYRTILENWLRETGMLPYKIIEFGTLEAILGCVVAGMGITLFPWSIIVKLNYTDKVNVHKIPEVLGRVPTMFIRRQDTFLTKAMDNFIVSIKQGNNAPI